MSTIDLRGQVEVYEDVVLSMSMDAAKEGSDLQELMARRKEERLRHDELEGCVSLYPVDGGGDDYTLFCRYGVD